MRSQPRGEAGASNSSSTSPAASSDSSISATNASLRAGARSRRALAIRGRGRPGALLPHLSDAREQKAHEARLPVRARLVEDLLEHAARRAHRDAEMLRGFLDRAAEQQHREPRLAARQAIELVQHAERVAAEALRIAEEDGAREAHARERIAPPPAEARRQHLEQAAVLRMPVDVRLALAAPVALEQAPARARAFVGR